MTVLPRSLARSALLVGCLGVLLPAIAAAQTYSSYGVHDNAKLFGEKAVEKANGMIDAIRRDYKKDVCIETFAKLPPEVQKEFDAADNKRQFWADLADKRYAKHDVKGIYILIVKSPAYYQFGVGKIEKKKAFTPDDREKAEAILKENLEAKTFDKGLLAVVNDIDVTLNRTVGKARAAESTTTKTSAPTKSSVPYEVPGGFSIWGIICIGLVIILALWVVIGVFRALTGAGRPVDRAPYGGQGGYGPQGGGGGYGPQGGGYAPQQGGGGGFMKSMFGGMLGAAGGMFLYDRFFGGGHSPMGGGGGMTPTAYGGTSSPVEPDDRMGDTGGGAWGGGGGAPADSGGGGDWGKGGDDGGGGSFGGGDDGGGGSFGGGGDDGGGGDWGGGGGGGGDSGGGDW